MPARTYHLKSVVLVYEGPASWRFLAVPADVAKEIKETFGKFAKSWGSLHVRVIVGATTWKTSLFPDSKLETYLLPLKAQVRKAERITDADDIAFTIAL